MVEDRKDLRFAPSLRGAAPTRERSPAMGDFARVSSAAVHRPFAPVRGTVRTSPKALESQHLGSGLSGRNLHSKNWFQIALSSTSRVICNPGLIEIGMYLVMMRMIEFTPILLYLIIVLDCDKRGLL